MKRKVLESLLAAGGVLLMAAGLLLLRASPEAEGAARVVPYLMVGLGSGMFGHGMGGIISRRALKGAPDVQKALEIERTDERNVMIGNAAKGKAFDLMTYLYGALTFSFAIMDIGIAPVLLLVAAYLFVHGYAVYWRIRLEKEM